MFGFLSGGSSSNSRNSSFSKSSNKGGQQQQQQQHNQQKRTTTNGATTTRCKGWVLLRNFLLLGKGRLVQEIEAAFERCEKRKLAEAVQWAVQYSVKDDLLDISRKFPPKYQAPGAPLECYDADLDAHLDENMIERDINLEVIAAEYDIHYKDFQAESCRASSKFLDVADTMDPLRTDVAHARASLAKAKQLALGSISIQRLYHRQQTLRTLATTLRAVQEVEEKTIAILGLVERGDFKAAVRQLGLDGRATPTPMMNLTANTSNSYSPASSSPVASQAAIFSPTRQQGPPTTTGTPHFPQETSSSSVSTSSASISVSAAASTSSPLASSLAIAGAGEQKQQQHPAAAGADETAAAVTTTNTNGSNNNNSQPPTKNTTSTSSKLVIRLKCDASNLPKIRWTPLMVVMDMPPDSESLLFPIHDSVCKRVLPFSFVDKENDPNERYKHSIINSPQRGEGMEVPHTTVGRIALQRWFSLRHPENPLLIVALQKAIVTAVFSRTTLERYNLWGDESISYTPAQPSPSSHQKKNNKSAAKQEEDDEANKTPEQIIQEECVHVSRFYEYYGVTDRTRSWVRRTVTKFYEEGNIDFMWRKLEAKYGSKAVALASSSSSSSTHSPSDSGTDDDDDGQEEGNEKKKKSSKNSTAEEQQEESDGKSRKRAKKQGKNISSNGTSANTANDDTTATNVNRNDAQCLENEVLQFVAVMEALDELGMPDEHCAEFIDTTLKRALTCLLRRILMDLTGEEEEGQSWTKIVKSLVPSEYRRFTLHVLSALMDVVRRVSVLRLQILRLKPDWSFQKQFSALGPDFVCSIGLHCVYLAAEFGRCISADRGVDGALQVYHLIFMFQELLEVAVCEHRDACLSRFSKCGSVPTRSKSSPFTKLRRMPEELRIDVTRRLMRTFQSSVILTTMNSLKMETWVEFTAFTERDFTGNFNSMSRLFWKMLPSDAIQERPSSALSSATTHVLTSSSSVASTTSTVTAAVSTTATTNVNNICNNNKNKNNSTLPAVYHHMLQLDLESRISELTRLYDTKNAHRIPSILERYKGKEAALIALLEDKYKVNQQHQSNGSSSSNNQRDNNKRDVIAKLGYRRRSAASDKEEEQKNKNQDKEEQHGTTAAEEEEEEGLLGHDSLVLISATVPNIFENRKEYLIPEAEFNDLFMICSTSTEQQQQQVFEAHQKIRRLREEEACETEAEQKRELLLVLEREAKAKAEADADAEAEHQQPHQLVASSKRGGVTTIFSGYAGTPVFTSASFILYSRMADWVNKARWCPNVACVLLDLVTTLAMHYVHFIALQFGCDLLLTGRATGPESSTFAFIEHDPSLPATFAADARVVSARARSGLPKGTDFPLLLNGEMGAEWRQDAANISQLCAAHARIKALESMRTVVHVMKQSVAAVSTVCCLPRNDDGADVDDESDLDDDENEHENADEQEEAEKEGSAEGDNERDDDEDDEQAAERRRNQKHKYSSRLITQEEHWERQNNDVERCQRLASLYYRAGFRRVSFALQNPTISVGFYEKSNWSVSAKSTIDPSQALDRLTRMTIDDLIDRIIKKEREINQAAASSPVDGDFGDHFGGIDVNGGGNSIGGGGGGNPHSIFGPPKHTMITPRQRLINYCVLNVFIGLVDGLTKVAVRQGGSGSPTASWSDIGRQKALAGMESIVKFAKNLLPYLPDAVLDYGLQFARAICCIEDLRSNNNSESRPAAAEQLRSFVSEHHALYRAGQLAMILDRVGSVGGAGKLQQELSEKFQALHGEDKSIYATVEDDIARYF